MEVALFFVELIAEIVGTLLVEWGAVSAGDRSAQRARSRREQLTVAWTVASLIAFFAGFAWGLYASGGERGIPRSLFVVGMIGVAAAVLAVRAHSGAPVRLPVLGRCSAAAWWYFLGANVALAIGILVGYYWL